MEIAVLLAAGLRDWIGESLSALALSSGTNKTNDGHGLQISVSL